MNTAIFFSDTHGYFPASAGFWQILEESGRIFHAGDGCGEIRTLESLYPDKFAAVRGNCDPDGVTERIVALGGTRLLLTHGHEYGVKRGLTDLAARCAALGVTYALFGHTHVPVIARIEGVTLINPGSLRAARTYCYLTEAGGKIYAKIVSLDGMRFPR